MSESIRCGVFFKAASRTIPVENFLKRVGQTRLDTSEGPQKNKQTYWFPSVAAFNKEMPGIIESVGRGTIHFPIPVFQVIEKGPEVTLGEASTNQSRDSSVVEQEAHNLQVADSISAPATITPEDSPVEDSQAPAEAPVQPVKNKGGRPRKHAK